METKIIPFDLEIAKKIQAGKIKGRIVTNEGNEVEIIRFDLIQNSFPILAIIRIPNVVSDYWEDTKLFQLNGRNENEKLWLEIELPEEAPKHKYIYEFDEDPEKLLRTEKIEQVAAKITVDGFVIKNRYEEHDYDKPKHEFKPFDRVLVRNENGYTWFPRLYERYSETEKKHYCQDRCGYNQCLQYEGNEHLVGTTNNP